jgi:hypothetical protein
MKQIVFLPVGNAYVDIDGDGVENGHHNDVDGNELVEDRMAQLQVLVEHGFLQPDGPA